MTVTVLTMEENLGTRDMLRSALVEAGFRVVEAADGLHGLDMLRLEVPHVVITGINMPGMDGFRFIETVRQNAKYSSLPILVLASENDDDKKMRARQAGATGWIVRPFDPARLIAAIRRVAC